MTVVPILMLIWRAQLGQTGTPILCSPPLVESAVETVVSCHGKGWQEIAGGGMGCTMRNIPYKMHNNKYTMQNAQHKIFACTRHMGI